jgi:very-short-patch-repair endonuclease
VVRSPPRRIELVLPEARRAVPPRGVIVRRAVAADQRVDDLHWPWRTTVEETILDVSATATADETFALLGRAFQKRLTNEAAVLGRLEQRSRHPHRALLGLVLAAATDGVESAIEGRYRDQVERAHGLPVGVRQLRRDRAGRERHDVGYPEQRVLVELDGRLGHEGFEAQVRDGRRDRRGAGSGWLTLRAFWPDVAVTPCLLATEVGAVLVDRGWGGRPRACRHGRCGARG